MLTVYRYPVSVKEDYFSLHLPSSARVLTFQAQYENPCMWVLLDPDAPPEARHFRLAGTGHPIKEDLTWLDYIGTCQIYGGSLVFHLFEVFYLVEGEVRE